MTASAMKPGKTDEQERVYSAFRQPNRLAKLLRHIPGVVYELRQHPDGHFSLPYASEKLWDIYGLSLEDVRTDASPLFATVHPEDSLMVRQSLQESATHLWDWHSTHRVCHPDGHCLWVSVHGTPERLADGGTLWYGHIENVIPLKQAQPKNLSPNKLRRIIHNLNEMVFIVAADGTFTFLSPVFETIMGYPLEQILHQSFTCFIHPQDLPGCIAVFQAALAGKRVQQHEYRVLHADGDYYWHSVNLSPFTEDDGETCCLGIASLIHARKQTELALTESELRLHLALEASNTGLWDWNMQTNEVVFNANWRGMLGYEEHEVANELNEWESRVHPEDLPKVYQDINRYLRGETDAYRNEHRLRCKDGSYKWILDQGRVVAWDEAGSPLRFVGTHTDINDRKQAELALIELTNQLKKAQEIASLGYWSFDLLSQKITWSEQVFKIFNRPLEQGEPSFEAYLEYLHPEDRPLLLEKIALATQGIAQDLDYRIFTADGTMRYLSNRISIEFRDGQVARMFGVVMDITNRRVAELELERFFTISLDLLCIADTRGHFRRLSRAWSDVLGYALEELEGRVFLDLIHPEDIPATLAAIARLKQGQVVRKFTNRYRTKSGNYRYIEWIAVAQGELIYATARDITDRMATQTQLESLLNRAQILNSLSQKIRQSLKLEQIIQTAVTGIFSELDVDICAFTRYWEADGHAYVEVLQEERRPDMVSWLGIYEATQFPQYRHALLNNQMLIFNRQNPGENYDRGMYQFCEAVGVNLSLMVPIHAADQITCLELARVDSSKDWQPDEIELLTNLGMQIAIAMQQAHLYQTAQQRSEELQIAYQDLKATQVQLIQAEKMSSLGQLVAGIAHEINNPVSFIYGNLKPLEEYVQDLLKIIEAYQNYYPNPPQELTDLMAELDLSFITADLPKILNSMKTGAARIRDIVKSLRTFARLDEADFKIADIHENIDNTLTILQNKLNGKAGKPEIKVVKKYGNLPLFECYIGLLNQVFMNLLLNAIQAIEERQITEADANYKGVITITTTLEPTGSILISVEDNGIGMSETVQAKIFEPFFTTKPVGSGTGMGLPTSHQIVTKYHQGEFYFNSKLGQGTTFFVRLPQLKQKRNGQNGQS